MQKKRPKKRRTVPSTWLCELCGELAKLVRGVKPRTCVECWLDPPKADKPTTKPKRERKR